MTSSYNRFVRQYSTAKRKMLICWKWNLKEHNPFINENIRIVHGLWKSCQLTPMFIRSKHVSANAILFATSNKVLVVFVKKGKSECFESIH